MFQQSKAWVGWHCVRVGSSDVVNFQHLFEIMKLLKGGRGTAVLNLEVVCLCKAGRTNSWGKMENN